MKYRILPLEIVQMVVDFLDDVQLEAAEEDDIVLVNHLQSLITELINSEEIFDNEEEALNYFTKFNESFSKFDTLINQFANVYNN